MYYPIQMYKADVMQSGTKITNFVVIICPHIQSNFTVAISQLHCQLRDDVLVNVLHILSVESGRSCWASTRPARAPMSIKPYASLLNPSLHKIWNDFMSQHTNFTANWVMASLSSHFGSLRVVFLGKYLSTGAAPVLLQLLMCFLSDDLPCGYQKLALFSSSKATDNVILIVEGQVGHLREIWCD